MHASIGNETLPGLKASDFGGTQGNMFLLRKKLVRRVQEEDVHCQNCHLIFALNGKNGPDLSKRFDFSSDFQVLAAMWQNLGAGDA